MSIPIDAADPMGTQSGTGSFVIDASIPPKWLDFQELLQYRELIWILTVRDIQVRYRQAVVGLAWVVLQPITQTFVFSIFFRLIRPSGTSTSTGTSILTILCGIVLWQLFASILQGSTNCLVDNRQLLTKVYFPRMVLPLSATLRPMIDFVVVFLVLLAVMVCSGTVPRLGIVLVPFIVALTLLVGLSCGLWLSALNAHYRDFGNIIPFALQIGFFISPVIIETSALIPENWRLVYALNPMSSLLELFRASILGSPWPSFGQLFVSTIVEVMLLVTGAWYFRRVEKFLADRI